MSNDDRETVTPLELVEWVLAFTACAIGLSAGAVIVCVFFDWIGKVLQ